MHLLVRDPLAERCALGLLALITALILFKTRVAETDPSWMQSVDGHALMRSAGFYGLFFGAWFCALLLHTLRCPRLVREHGSKDRAMESFVKSQPSTMDQCEYDVQSAYFDQDNASRRIARFAISALMIVAVGNYLASLLFLTEATFPVLY